MGSSARSGLGLGGAMGDIKWAWGHLEPRLALLSSKALAMGHTHFAFFLVRLAPRNNLAWWEAEENRPGASLVQLLETRV